MLMSTHLEEAYEETYFSCGLVVICISSAIKLRNHISNLGSSKI